ncbi:MAG: signal peptidase I [Actinomycetota bacterium]|nr:signal peptidase I [Actinomycetota bacterium]
MARRRTWRPVVVAVVVLSVVAGWWLRGNVVGSYRVESGSMAPTLCAGDRVLVDKRVTGPDLARGDLVVLTPPHGDGLVVKRVVGLPGDRVAINDALLFVNRQRVREPYVDHKSIDALFYGPVRVPVQRVLVMGDARAASIDSRDYGPVTFSSVHGRVLLRWWSSCD